MLPNVGLMRFPKNTANRSLLVVKSLFVNGEQGAWYDPSDFSTLFQDAAGTTPVTAVGQPVGRILDKSGRGNHATQATTANRPVLQQDAGGHYYLAFNGTNSSMATAAINFTATDKMTVVAGVRKLSDATTGIVTELSVISNTNDGSFKLTAPETNLTATIGSSSRGTALNALNQVATASGIAAPISCIVATTHDIAGSLTTLRVNTVAATNATGNKGTGNFGTYPLYIGARAGTSLFFNGNIYSLIVRGAASSASQIQALEAYANSKTGAY